MKFSLFKLLQGLVIVLATTGVLATQSLAQTVVKRQGYCERGGQRVNTNGASSTTTVQQSLPSCTITVYLTGTVTLATLYSNAAGTTPLANPFTADATGYYFYYTTPGRYDERFSGGTAPNNIASPFTKTDIQIGAGVILSNQGVDLPIRPTINLTWPFLLGMDNATDVQTELRTNRIPSGVYNAVTDLNISADPRLYLTTTIIPVGATSVTLTGVTAETQNGIPDTATNSVYPLKYLANSTNTFKVGQGIRIPDGVAMGIDLVTTITAVNGNVITFQTAVTYNNAIDFIQHDDTGALNSFFATYTAGTLQIPDGVIPVSSFHNYTTGKDWAVELPLSSEALNHQWVIEGQGPWRSGFIMTGPGHLMKLKDNTTNNLIIDKVGFAHANRYQLQTLDNDSAGVGLYLASDNFNSEGVPQSGATNVRLKDVNFIGWRYAVFSDNLQSSQLENVMAYYCSNNISLISTSSVRGLGSQTEANANQINQTFFQYAPVSANNVSRNVTVTTAGAHNTSGTLIGTASAIVTLTVGTVSASDLYRIVKINGASVSQTEHWAMIIAVNNSTQITLSQAPWIANAGLTMTIFPKSTAHIFLNNANNIEIRGGTWQGNWQGDPAGQELYALLVYNSDEVTMDGIWIEGNGGQIGAAYKAVSSRSLAVLNSNFGGGGPTDGYGTAMILDGVTGMTIDASYIATSGTASDFNFINGTRGVKINNSTLTSGAFLEGNNTDPTANFWPVELGPGVRFLASGFSDGSMSSELNKDSLYARNELINGNYKEGLTGWSLNRPGALTAVDGGNARGLRYIRIAPSTINPEAFVTQFSQTVSIPDSVQRYYPITLGYDYYLESRGSDNGSIYNGLRVKLVFSDGTTLQYTNPSDLATGRILQRWQRQQIQARVPNAAVSRTVQVIFEAAEGSNAGIFRVANLRLTYSTRATYDDDEVISELRGGTIYNGATFRIYNAAGGGTRSVCVDNNGYLNPAVFGCASGGGAGTVTSVGYALGTTGSDLNFSGTTSPITTSGAFVLNVPNAGVGVRGVIPGSGSQSIGATWTLTNLLTTVGIQPTVDNVSTIGATNHRYNAIHLGGGGLGGLQVHGDAIDLNRVLLTYNGTTAALDASSTTTSFVWRVSTAGLAMDGSGIVTATGSGGLNTSALVTGQVAIARGGTNSTSASYSTNGAFYYDGTKFVTTATGGVGTLCLTSASGGAPTWGACSGSTATALSSITAAAAGNTINSGDNSQVWNWTLTTSGAKGFRFSENSASAAAGTPVLIAIDTLSTSTVNPFQVTAQGTANGVRVNTAGLLARIGTGDIRASEVYLDNAGTGVFTVQQVINETLTNDRTLTFTLNDGNKVINMGGNLTLASSFTTVGANALTFTTGGVSNATIPVGTITLADLTSTQTFTNKTLTSPVINVGSDATGDVYYRNAGIFTRLAIGSSGQCLTVSVGVPAWASCSGSSSLPSIIRIAGSNHTMTTEWMVAIDTLGTNRTLTPPSAASNTNKIIGGCKSAEDGTIATVTFNTVYLLTSPGSCQWLYSNGTSWIPYY